MTLTRTQFFLPLFCLLTLPFVLPRLVWLRGTQTTTGLFAFAGMGSVGDQMPLSYSVIYFRHGRDTVWFNGLGNLGLHPGDRVPVRYKVNDPSDAKVDIFAAIWGDILVYTGIPVLMLLAIYLHPEVVPKGSKIKWAGRPPFLLLVPGRSRTVAVSKSGTVAIKSPVSK
jgi:hypothetical protein